MSPFVTGSMVFLVALIALVEPPADIRVEVTEHTVLPGVTYRVERRWRMVSDAVIAEQVDHALADLQHHRPLDAYRKGTWWITRTCRAYWSGLRTWFANQQLRPRLVRLYRTLPSNWYPSDLGIARNGKPLPIPPALAASIWQHQMLRDQQTREWSVSLFPDLFETDGARELVIGDPSSNEVIDVHLEQAFTHVSFMAAEAVRFRRDIVVDTDGTVEAVHIPPYLLLIHNDQLIGVIGGGGRFDQIPPGWAYLRH